jgi:Domain of unknown function (DUF4382)
LAVLTTLIAPWGCGSGGGGGTTTPVKKNAEIAVGFIGGPPSAPQGLPGFRSVLLNISQIRLNPSATAGLNDSKWVTIPVPPATGPGTGSSPGDMQIDLNNLQTGATLFNTTSIPVGTYAQVQVVVDTTIPGTIIPACQATNVNQEGCTNYPLVFTTPNQAITLALKTPISASKDQLAVLLLQLNLTIDTPPTTTGGAYGITVTLGLGTAGSYLGLVTGTVHKSGGSQSSSSSLSVSAEPAGTGNVIASVPVTNGNFSLELPASPVTGTAYDLFVSGGGFTFDAQRDIRVFTGSSNAPLEFSVKSIGTASVGGNITDACTGSGIAGATVELLSPPSNVSTSVDCTATPQDCVAVATTSTDETGAYPLPVTRKQPSTFTQVPTGNQGLALDISASGYTTLATALQTSSSNKNNFSLLTGYIAGTVSLTQAPPSGQSVQVGIFAENSGTNDLVSALATPLTFRAGQTSVPFTLNVPVPPDSSSPAPVFDLFASAIDPYVGSTNPYTGHTIEVASAVPGQASECQTTANVTLGPLDCVGHGSLSGTVINPDTGTTVEVIKDGVQILGTAPGFFSSAPGSNNASYALCVPPGAYTVQRFEDSATGTELSAGPSTTVAVPVPTSTSTPCPSTCGSTSDCPGQCFATNVKPL